MTSRALTQEQIEEGRKLRAEGWTKKQLATKFNVSPTAIWENIYTTTKRYRGYVKARECCYYCNTPLSEHARCVHCGMLLHDDVLKNENTEEYRCGCGMNHTARVGDSCVSCYAQKNGISYPNTNHKHTFEELSRIYGMSKESLAQFEKKMHSKILKSKPLMNLMGGTNRYGEFTKKKVKAIKKILNDIPDDMKHRHDDLDAILDEWLDSIDETE